MDIVGLKKKVTVIAEKPIINVTQDTDRFKIVFFFSCVYN